MSNVKNDSSNTTPTTPPAHKSVLRIWCVTKFPTDYPDKYVARLWENNTPTATVMITPEYDNIELFMLNMGLVKILPGADDDPVIAETWL